MIVESADHSALATRPLFGVAAGLAGAALLLVVLTLVSGADASGRWLAALGRLMLPASAESPAAAEMWGGILHFAIGGILGALHGACQQRTAVSGLFVVGGFYGFVVWLVGGLVGVRLLHLDLPLLGWAGLLPVVTFGLVLAAWAAVDQQRTSRLVTGARPVD